MIISHTNSEVFPEAIKKTFKHPKEKRNIITYQSSDTCLSLQVSRSTSQGKYLIHLFPKEDDVLPKVSKSSILQPSKDMCHKPLPYREKTRVYGKLFQAPPTKAQKHENPIAVKGNNKMCNKWTHFPYQAGKPPIKYILTIHINLMIYHVSRPLTRIQLLTTSHI